MTFRLGRRYLYYFADLLPDLHSLKSGSIQSGFGAEYRLIRASTSIGMLPDLSLNAKIGLNFPETNFWLDLGGSSLTQGVTGPQWLATATVSYRLDENISNPLSAETP
jgi:hypothetical protein